jgi:2-oxoglutarate ferredoxin oxidoreductase subunit gamma
MSNCYHVTYLPAYGAEVHGGTANCTIAIGDEEITSPISLEPDNLVAMNSPSLITFHNKVIHSGMIFLNSSIVENRPSRDDVMVYAIPCNKMAQDLGNIRVANVIMMAAFIKKTGIVTADIYLKSLETIMGSKKGGNRN